MNASGQTDLGSAKTLAGTEIKVRLDPQTPLSEQDLTLAIYDAVTCPELWADVANALQRFVLCDTVDFMLLNGSTGDQIIDHISSDDFYGHRDDAAHYLGTNTRVARTPAKPSLVSDDGQQLFTSSGGRRRPIRNPLLPRPDIAYTIGTHLAVAAPFVGRISCGQRALRGPFQEEQRQRLNVFLPHLQRAMALRLALWQIQEGTRLLADALDCLPNPMLVLEPSGTVLHANERAQTILQANDGLTLRQRHIETTDRQTGHRLMAVLRDVAMAADDTAAAPTSRTLKIERPSGRPPYRLKIQPARHNPELWQIIQRQALTVLIGGDAAAYPSPRCEEMLRTRYRLTPAEAALASAFGKGVSLREYAERRAISVQTVRFQMKQVLAKTECARQADLARLLANC